MKLEDGETLFFYDSGAGALAAAPAASDGAQAPKENIVLIHGLGDESDTWRHLVPLLADRFRVLALDLPGFGRSAAHGRISLKRHTRAVIKLLQETGPAILVGNSMGCMVAELAAVEMPSLVKGLVLLDGCLPLKGGSPAMLLMCMPFLGSAWYRAFRKNEDAAYASLEPYYGSLAALPEEDRQFLRKRVMERVNSESQEKAYFASFRSTIGTVLFAGGAVSKKIAAYKGKILLIWGENDKMFPPDAASPLRAIRPDAVWKLVRGVGHLPQQEAPEQAAKAILENF
jgi:pimeloyl-ACP methyl ester carboxylesterase